jgi:hypothetical protein
LIEGSSDGWLEGDIEGSIEGSLLGMLDFEGTLLGLGDSLSINYSEKG